MNHYNIVLSTELLDVQAYNQMLDTLYTKCQQLKPSTLGDFGSSFVTVIRPVQELQEEKSQKQDDLWTELTEEQDIGNVAHYHVPITESETECPNKLLLQRIHELGENIPQIGVFVSVFWLIRDESLPTLSDNIELYGACKRLLEWNNASFKFVTFTSDVKDDCLAEPWVTILRGHTISCEALNNQAAVLWRGKLRKPVQLPGFEMISVTSESPPEDQSLEQMFCDVGRKKKDDELSKRQSASDRILPRLLSNKLEVIAQLDRQEIPLLYYTGNCCHLLVPSQGKLVDKSRQFLQRLEDNSRLCYLVRLSYGTSWKNVKDENCYKNNETREKKLWSDFVQENIEHILHCPVAPELDGELGQYIILLCAVSKSCSQTSADDFVCEAHLLRLPNEFNGSFTHQVAVGALWQVKLCQKDAEENKKFAETLFAGLPNLTAKHLFHLRKTIKLAQIAALQAWIDRQRSSGRSLDICEADLMALLRAAHSQVIYSFVQCDDLQNRSSAVMETDGDDDDSNNDKNISEGYEAPTKPLERLVLEYFSQKESKLNDCKSNSSLAGLCPPSRGKVVTLNAAEFLKFFKEDGTAAMECSSQVTLQKSNSCKRLMKLNFEDLKNIKWPECESLQFHDIYYNHGITEAIEQRSKRLLSRFLTTETSSTCIYRQAHNPVIMTVGSELDHVKQEAEGDKQDRVIEERVTRSAVKRKELHELMTVDSKRLYAAKKSLAEARRSMKGANTLKKKASLTSDSSALSDIKAIEKAKRESRSQRHKRKLEEIVKQTLKKHGVKKDDPLFKACALRLYNITKSFVKDLTSSVGLREEMERIAESNVQMIVDFERKNRHGTKK